MKKHYSTTVEGAESLAQQIAPLLHGGETIALYGPLGSGKTTFVKHLAKLLSYSGHVTSPTFTLLQTYKGKTTTGSPLYIHHLDLYRLESAEEALLSGIVEPWGEQNSVSLIEWADKAQNLLPKDTISITFTPL